MKRLVSKSRSMKWLKSQGGKTEISAYDLRYSGRHNANITTLQDLKGTINIRVLIEREYNKYIHFSHCLTRIV